MPLINNSNNNNHDNNSNKHNSNNCKVNNIDFVKIGHHLFCTLIKSAPGTTN